MPAPAKRPGTVGDGGQSKMQDMYVARDQVVLRNKVSYFEKLAQKVAEKKRPATSQGQDYWSRVRGAALIAQHLPKAKMHEDIVEGLDEKQVKSLKSVYASYCQFGSSELLMDGGKFSKFAFDAGIAGASNKQIDATDVDIIYMNAKGHDKKLTFEGFCRALDKIASKSKMDMSAMSDKVVKALANDAHGVEAFDKDAWKAEIEEPSEIEGLRALFDVFASSGGAKALVDKKGRVLGYEMDMSRLTRMCRDLGLINTKFPQSSVERVFAKARSRGANKLSYTDFRWAVYLMSEEKGMAYYMLAYEMAERGPQAIKYNATKAQNVRQYQVKETPTEVKERANWKEGLDTPSDMEGLQDVFDRFCAYGGGKPVVGDNGEALDYEIDGTRFNKLCRDCGLLTGKVTSSVADAIFIQAHEGQKMAYEEFRWAVFLLADYNDMAYPTLAFGIVQKGPEALQLNNVTKAEEVRFYEIKKQISKTRSQKVVDFRDDRDIPSDVEGLPELFILVCATAAEKKRAMIEGEVTEFEMEPSKWTRMCRDLGAIDRRVTSATADGIYARVKGKGKSKGIDYLDFRWCLVLLAEAKGEPYHMVAYDLCKKAKDGALFSNATKADDVRLYEMRKEHVGVKEHVDWRLAAAAQYEEHDGVPSDADGLMGLFVKVCSSGGHKKTVDKVTKEEWWEMDGSRFIKMCRDIGVVDDKGVTSAVVDAIYSKAKPKGTQKIAYIDFRWALHLLAEHQKQPYHILVYDLVQGSDLLFSNATRADDVRLYEVKKRHTEADMKSRVNWREGLEEPSDVEGLEDLFERVCKSGGAGRRRSVGERESAMEMDANRFAKMVRDCGMVGGKITSALVDNLFVKAKKDPHDHGVDYTHFRWALHLLAEEREEPYHLLAHGLIETAKDALFSNATKAEDSRFYEVKEAPKEAKGGVATDWREKYTEQLAESNGVPSDADGLRALFERVCASGGHKKTVDKVTKEEWWDMAGNQFSKMVKDVGVFEGKAKKLEGATVDNCFAKACQKGHKKVDYLDFRWAMLLLAEAMGDHYHLLVHEIVKRAPDMLFKGNSTQAEDVRFYEQKKVSTKAMGGVAKDWRADREKPSEVEGLKDVYKKWVGKESFDPKTKKSLGYLLDATHFARIIKESGVLGGGLKADECDRAFLKVKKTGEKRIPYEDFLWALDLLAEKKGCTYHDLAHSVRDGAGEAWERMHDSSAQNHVSVATKPATPRVREQKGDPRDGVMVPPDVEGLKKTFVAYCGFGMKMGASPGKEMDSKQFMKMCKDCGLVDKITPSSSLDMVFVKAKHKGARKLGYEDFRVAVNLVARDRGTGYQELAKALAESPGPVVAGTTGEAPKLASDARASESN